MKSLKRRNGNVEIAAMTKVLRIALLFVSALLLSNARAQDNAGNNSPTPPLLNSPSPQPTPPLPNSPTPQLSFRRDVMPVFFRATCNSGGCHGAAAGKDGFRLSLFGYDPSGDYFRLVEQLVGRRVDVAQPEQSLLLLKATGRVPHTGGKLFDEKSAYYATLLKWIEQGANDDAEDVAVVTSIRLEPTSFLFDGPARERTLKVVASYSDGSTRDVTALTLFQTNNKNVADVNADGGLKAGTSGATDVFARFDKFSVGAEVVVLPQNDRFEWPRDVQPINALDERVQTRLRQLRILPSELCDDETFLRRVSLDLIGLPPTEAEYRRFMSDSNSDRDRQRNKGADSRGSLRDPTLVRGANHDNKREQLVDELLKRPEYADLWATKWAAWLKLIGDTNSGGGFDHKAAFAYFEWLTKQFRNNVPLDQFVREQVAARGSNFLQPEVNFYTMLPAGNYEAKAVAQDVAQLFTGMRIQCAECHNHPFDRWTMDDYYGFVSFFTGIRRKTASEPREFYIYNDNASLPAEHLLDQRPMPPKFLGGPAPDSKGKDPRAALAVWLTSPENELFSRNMSNRLWAHFFGRGIIEPIDDFRITNPPSNGPLLDELSRRLVEYRFDQKRLIRDIVLSRTYQSSARTNDTNRSDERQFSHAAVRRLPAVMALDAVSAATGVETRFKSLPPGYRAMQVYDSGRRHQDYFLSTFGQSERKTVCASDDVTEPSFAQTLHLINGDTILKKLERSTVIKEAIAAKQTPPQIVESLFLRTLGRQPTAREQAAFVEVSGKSAQPSDYVNLWWALLNSTEFLFQH